MGNIFDRQKSDLSIAMVETKLTKLELGLLNTFYPVGTYYETSDVKFNPNKTWGGTWESVNGRWHRTK